MNWTGDADAGVDGGVVTAASTWNRAPSFHTGVMSVSSSALPSTKEEDPRKRRRGLIIVFRHYRNSTSLLKTRAVAAQAHSPTPSLGPHLRKRARNRGQLVHLPAGPGNGERLDLRSLAQSEMNARIARRHIAGAALGLVDLNHALGRQFENGADAVAI